MVSAHNPNPLYITLAFIIFTVFTVTLTENIQLADGFSSASTVDMKYNLGVGETQVQEWKIYNSNQTTHIEFVAENPGSEYLTFEKSAVLEPNEVRAFEFIVSIPADHPDNIKYIVALIAKEVKPATEGGSSSVMIAYEMIARPSISIGDNPIYTQPVAPVVVEEEPTIQAEISDDDFGAVEEIPLETIEEKMARINQANAPAEVQVDDTWEESFEEEAVKDYVPEPMSEPVTAPVVAIVTVEECGWWDMILSLFGMAKC
jgi:hypothetical protein